MDQRESHIYLCKAVLESYQDAEIRRLQKQNETNKQKTHHCKYNNTKHLANEEKQKH